MSFIESNYEKVKAQKTGFLSGTKPDWLTEIINGAGSITYETGNGGRAVLQPGTGSTGDEVKLGIDGLNLNDFDGLYIRNVVQHGPDAASKAQCETAVGFEDGDASERCQHFINSGNGDTRNSFNYSTTGFEGGDRKFQTRAFNGAAIQETEVLFDVTNGIAVHRFHDTLSRTVSDVTLDNSTYLANSKIKTEDTSTDWRFYIYEFELGYLRHK